jgi:hypothetical protein
LKDHYYKNLVRLIHDEKTTIAGFVETNRFMDTNAKTKYHIGLRQRMTPTPPRRKKKGRKTSVVDAVKSGL